MEAFALTPTSRRKARVSSTRSERRAPVTYPASTFKGSGSSRRVEVTAATVFPAVDARIVSLLSQVPLFLRPALNILALFLQLIKPLLELGTLGFLLLPPDL